MRSSLASFAAALLTAGSLAAAGGEASASAATPMGSVISNPELAVAGGTGKQAPQGADTVNVLLFFRPDKEYSRTTLKELAACEKRTAGKPVRWTAIVSDRQPQAEAAAAVKEAGLAMPVLVDAGDALYVELGIAQLPAAAITDRTRKLVEFQPFTKLNFCELVEARVRKALGEITEKDVAAVANPQSSAISGGASVANRHVKMAELFLRNGDAEKAIASARDAVKGDAASAAAHSVLGAALAAGGDCKGAVPEFAEALKLDPKDVRAAEGKKGCAGK